MVRANRELLHAAREQVLAAGAAELRLNLFDDADFVATLERSAPTASGYTLSGPLDGVPFGRAVLVVNDGVTMGRVYTPAGNYSIRGTERHQSVERLPAAPPGCAADGPACPAARQGSVPHPHPHAEPPGLLGAGTEARPTGPLDPVRPEAAGDHALERRDEPHASAAPGSTAAEEDGVVDVLVVYPSFVRDLEGGYGAMLAIIDLDFATANEAYAASGIELRVNVAAAVEVEYGRFRESAIISDTGTGTFGPWEQALEDLTGRNDGYLDEVHALRDRHAADLVLLHLGGRVHQAVADYLIGGIAWSVYDVSADALEAWGFSVARSGYGTVVAHELGHSMGLHHDRFEGSRNRPFPYSHGFRYKHAYVYPDGYTDHLYTHGTIMSRYSEIRGPGTVLAFSNPDLVHPQNPDLRLGVAGDEPSNEPDGPADAARHLNELRETLVNVRSRSDADPCTYELAGDEGVLPADGGVHRVRVATQPGCAWTVDADPSVLSVSNAEGAGTGEIRYEVAANDGFQRQLELLVAGRLHTRVQAGSRPITPVCERSRPVREGLMLRHPDCRCGLGVLPACESIEFDADYLAGLTEVPLNQHGPVLEYRAGDFDGFTGVSQINMGGVERLPPDQFFGMTGLRLLYFDSSLREIAPGAFRGLPGLKWLQMDGHRLGRLPRGAFDGLTGLVKLEIGFWWEDYREGAMTLEPGAFRELANLRVLLFFGNELGALDPGVFSGLQSLRHLFLSNNLVDQLSPGTFQGLQSLERLYLPNNRLERLSPGTFQGLQSLDRLHLHNNRLEHISRATFEGLRSLTHLSLGSNRLTGIEPGTFTGSPNLKYLYLGNNRLRTLESGAFDGLSSLEQLDLQINRLRNLGPGLFEGLDALYELFLRRNALGVIRAGTFDGLERLGRLYLEDAGVTHLELGVFDGTPDLSIVRLDKNRLQTIPPGTFRGLDLRGLQLSGNPGAPFPFVGTMIPVTAESGVGRPVRAVMEVTPEPPFEVGAELSVSGGSLSSSTVDVDPGQSRSEDVSVTPDGDGPVSVRVDRLQGPGVAGEETTEPDGSSGGITIFVDIGLGFAGFRTVPGPPLSLYGIEDRSFVKGRAAETIDLSSVFSYFLDAAEYEVSSSDESIAGVRVEGGTLTVTPGATGTAEVTVTATAADGETMTRRFTVTVRVPSVPLFLANSHPAREGFVRVLNHSAKSGGVRIMAIDDAGNRHGPVRLRVRAHGAAHFNSTDLKQGNETKRLLEGVGVLPAEGNWRLEFQSDLDVEALSYVRTEDGFLTAIHDAAPSEAGVHRIATFNPASNMQQVSRLRVANTGREAAEVTVRGVDDAGASPGSAVRFTVPPGAAREFDAMQLEAGDAWLDGALGDGEGKWRLTVESDSPIVAMSLLENASTGHLTNLSAVPPPPDRHGVHHVALFPAAGGATGRQGFARVINRSDESGAVRIDAFDDAGVRYGPLELEVDAGAVAHFNSEDLELGASGKGLTGSTGTGAGDWRLELSSALDIEALAYVRTEDGFLTAIHDVVAAHQGRRRVALFNPGSNADQVSLLRLVNTTSKEVEVSAGATDDHGRAPPHRGATWIAVPAGAALTLNASELEAGVRSQFYLDLEERYPDEGTYDETFSRYWARWPLGDGVGKWRLSVDAAPGVLVQSLLESPTGHLTNLSSAPRAGAH